MNARLVTKPIIIKSEEDILKYGTRVVSVGLDPIQREKLEQIALNRYQIGRNLSNTLRLMIDEVFGVMVEGGMVGEVDREIVLNRAKEEIEEIEELRKIRDNPNRKERLRLLVKRLDKKKEKGR